MICIKCVFLVIDDQGGYLPGNVTIQIVDVVGKKEVDEFKDPGNSHYNQKLQRQNLTSKFYEIVLSR